MEIDERSIQNPQPGMKVKYMPSHAGGLDDPICEVGVISKVELNLNAPPKVWVRFNSGETGALTPIDKLFKL